MIKFSKTTTKLIEISEIYGKNFLERTNEEVSEIINRQIDYLEKTEFNNNFQDPRELIHLDTNKLALHPDRLKAFLNGERVAPITIDMALTQKCSYACTFCYAGLQQNPRFLTGQFKDFLKIALNWAQRKQGEGDFFSIRW